MMDRITRIRKLKKLSETFEVPKPKMIKKLKTFGVLLLISYAATLSSYIGFNILGNKLDASHVQMKSSVLFLFLILLTVISALVTMWRYSKYEEKVRYDSVTNMNLFMEFCMGQTSGKLVRSVYYKNKVIYSSPEGFSSFQHGSKRLFFFDLATAKEAIKQGYYADDDWRKLKRQLQAVD